MGTLVSPGALARAHADLEGLRACAKCHTAWAGTPDAKCMACHEEVRQRVRQRVGFHGTLTGRCAGCHVDHRGVDHDLPGLERAGFNHDRALFPLRGAHTTVECDKCHVRAHPETGRRGFRTLGIAHERCATCHEDVHGAEFLAARDCGACHADAGFDARHLLDGDVVAGPPFEHDRDGDYALTGRHTDLDCRRCHTRERALVERAEGRPPGTAAPRACASCHDDPHRGALRAGCRDCHTTADWAGPAAIFDHDRHTGFPLDRVHAVVACDGCHADARFRAEGTRCESCHRDAQALLAGRFEGLERAPDPHGPRLACRDCHPEPMKRSRLTDYEPLCVGCHAPEYGQLLLTRRRILDGMVVRAEGALRARELALEREGRSGRSGRDGLPELRRDVERLARSGVHNADLAEEIMARTIERLSRAPETAP